jgi:hypothetical protein
MSLNLKAYQNQGGIKNKLILKTWKGGSNEAKRKASGQNIERGYQKPHVP